MQQTEGEAEQSTAAAAALRSTTIKTGGGNAPRRRHVMNVHWWRATTSVHPEASPHLHLLRDAPPTAAFLRLSSSFLFAFSFISRSDVDKVEARKKREEDRDRR